MNLVYSIGLISIAPEKPGLIIRANMPVGEMLVTNGSCLGYYFSSHFGTEAR